MTLPFYGDVCLHTLRPIMPQGRRAGHDEPTVRTASGPWPRAGLATNDGYQDGCSDVDGSDDVSAACKGKNGPP